jgi:predicted aspartyl protease
VGHVFVRARFKGRGVVEFEKILVDTGASFTVMPLDVAERHFIETRLQWILNLVMEGL